MQISFLEYVQKKDAALRKKLIDTYGKYEVFSVNGKAVRDSSKEGQEFGGSSYHELMPKVIPQNEIWIEDDVKEEERQVLIASALYGLRAMKKGMSPKCAYDETIKKEKDYRESKSLSKKNPSATDKAPSQDIYIEKYGDMRDEGTRIEVYLVDGEKVRNRYKADFIEGGHGYVYSWIPNQEIWIEMGPNTSKEAPYILLHEYLERAVMKYKNMPYEKAHKLASKIEWNKRCETTGSIVEGYSKEEVLSLSKGEILRMAKKRSVS